MRINRLIHELNRAKSEGCSDVTFIAKIATCNEEVEFYCKCDSIEIMKETGRLAILNLVSIN